MYSYQPSNFLSRKSFWKVFGLFSFLRVVCARFLEDNALVLFESEQGEEGIGIVSEKQL